MINYAEILERHKLLLKDDLEELNKVVPKPEKKKKEDDKKDEEKKDDNKDGKKEDKKDDKNDSNEDNLKVATDDTVLSPSQKPNANE